MRLEIGTYPLTASGGGAPRKRGSGMRGLLSPAAAGEMSRSDRGGVVTGCEAGNF